MNNSLHNNNRPLRSWLQTGACSLFLLFALPFYPATAQDEATPEPAMVEQTDVKTLDVKTDIPQEETAETEKTEPVDDIPVKKAETAESDEDSTEKTAEPVAQTPVDETEKTDAPQEKPEAPDTAEKTINTTEGDDAAEGIAPTEKTETQNEAEKAVTTETVKKAPTLKRPQSKGGDYIPMGKISKTVTPWMAEIGLNNPDFTGLLYNFWYDSKAEDLTRYINMFERSSTSPAVRNMMVETLISVTRAPKFRSTNPAADDINLMKARLSALIRIGAFDEAVLLYQKVLDTASAGEKALPIGEEIATLGVEAMALTGATDAACLEVNLVSAAIPSNKWLKDKSLCLLQWKQHKAARVLFDFIRQDTDNFAKPYDKTYRTVFNAVISRTADTALLSTKLPPLWNSILLSQKVPVSAQTIKDNAGNTLLLGLLSRHEGITDTTRSLATAYTAQKGMMSLDKIRNTYLNTNFDATLIGSTIETGGSKTRRQDILYYAARRAYAPDRKAALQKRGLSLIKDKTSIPAYLWSDLDRELSYNAVKLEKMATHSRSRLLANSVLAYADDWVKKINLEKDEKNQYKDTQNRVLEHAFSDKQLTEEELHAWVLYLQETFPNNGNERALKSLITLEYTKQPVPRKIWALVGGKPEPVKLDFGLLKSDENARSSYVKYYKGDIYLAVLAHFSHSGIDKLSPQELLSFMDLFKKYGLSDKNMKIGLEILSQSVL